MNAARMGHFIAELADGRVVVFGGHGAGFASLNSIEIWTPASNRFALVNTPHPFDGGALVRLADGRYLMAGGSTDLGGAPGYNTAQIFDPQSGAVTSTGSVMTRKRTLCRGALLGGGKALIAGAWYNTDGAAYGEVYDPVQNRFTATGPLQTPRAFPLVLPAAGGKAIVAGGMGPFGSPGNIESVEQYDPVANSFSPLAATLFAGETGWAVRTDGERAVDDQRMADGRYVFLASRTMNGLTEWALALFDPATATFGKLALDPAWQETGTVWPPVLSRGENAVYFMAGKNTNSAANLTFAVHRIDLALGRRMASGPLSVAGYYPGNCASALLKDGRLLVTGGTSRVDGRYNFEPVRNAFWVKGLPAQQPVAITPELTWSRKSGQIVLAWPAEAAGFSLESSTALGTLWHSVAEPAQIVGDEMQVTLEPVEKQQFFRLRKP